MTAPTDRDRDFITFLAALAGKDSTGQERGEKQKNLAALAALRRGLGKRPGEAAAMFPYVVPFVPDLSRRPEDYFLVASLFASHQLFWPHPADPHELTNLGASFHWLRSKVDSGSIEKRFVALLDAPREDLPEHLRHAVSLLKAHDVPLDWLQLLLDVHGWDWESRSVQYAWARAYWRVDLSQSQSQQTAQPTPQSSAS
jgi:CRISPR system Cascade subunit CasB